MKVCTFDSAGLCRGCFRTRAEARGWKRLSDAEKAAVNRRVWPLIAATGSAGNPKRLRKLDKRIARLEKKLAALRAERQAAVSAT